MVDSTLSQHGVVYSVDAGLTGTAATSRLGAQSGYDARVEMCYARSQIDPTNTNYVYGEYVWLLVHRSTNGSRSTRFAYSGLSDAPNRRANFIAPLVLDPNNALRLYGDGESLWRSDNARASSTSWGAIKSGVGSYISATAITVGDPDLIYLDHNYYLYRSPETHRARVESLAATVFDADKVLARLAELRQLDQATV